MKKTSQKKVTKNRFRRKTVKQYFFRRFGKFFPNLTHSPIRPERWADGGWGMKRRPTKDISTSEVLSSGADSETQNNPEIDHLVHLFHRFGHSAKICICSIGKTHLAASNTGTIAIQPQFSDLGCAKVTFDGWAQNGFLPPEPFFEKSIPPPQNRQTIFFFDPWKIFTKIDTLPYPTRLGRYRKTKAMNPKRWFEFGRGSETQKCLSGLICFLDFG